MHNKPLTNLVIFGIGLFFGLFFSNSNDSLWQLLSVTGSIMAAIGVSNISFYFIEYSGSADDLVIPGILTIVLAISLAIFRNFGFFGLSGFSLNLAETLGKIFVFAPAIRLYVAAVKLIGYK